jgi:hypothetical protein
MAIVMLAGASSALGQSPSKRRAAPPKFDAAEVERIFFPDARAHLKGPRPTTVAETNTTNNARSAATNIPTTTDPPATSGGSFVWSKLISTETLANEIKQYPPLLTAELKSPTQFKGGGYRKARNYFSALAATMAIIAQHDGDVRWKNQAAAARELFARAGFNSKSGTDQSFNEAKLRSEDLAALLRGETIAAPSGIEPNPSFNEQVSNRPPLMARLKRAHEERIVVWTSNPEEFKKNLEGVKHEAEIVAALSKIIQHPSYTDADSDSYIQYANAMQTAALELGEAVQQKNAAAARTAAGNISKACNSCHGDFRGG